MKYLFKFIGIAIAFLIAGICFLALLIWSFNLKEAKGFYKYVITELRTTKWHELLFDLSLPICGLFFMWVMYMVFIRVL